MGFSATMPTDGITQAPDGLSGPRQKRVIMSTTHLITNTRGRNAVFVPIIAAGLAPATAITLDWPRDVAGVNGTPHASHRDGELQGGSRGQRQHQQTSRDITTAHVGVSCPDQARISRVPSEKVVPDDLLAESCSSTSLAGGPGAHHHGLRRFHMRACLRVQMIASPDPWEATQCH